MYEILDIVDENDKVIGSAERGEIHSTQNWHRCVHVIIKDPKNRILIQKRSHDRNKYPDVLDISVSEHVRCGESYEDAAKRGAREELGIDIDVKSLWKHRHNYDGTDFMFAVVFDVEYDGKVINPDRIEVSDIKFYSMEELETMMRKSPEMFGPWVVEIINQYRGRESELCLIE